MKKSIFVFLFLGLMSASASAQIGGFGGGSSGGGGNSGGFGSAQNQKDKVSWTYSLSKSEVEIGDTILITLTGQIEPDWYIYSNDFDPSLGPNLAEFEFISHADYKTLGKTKAVGSKSHYEDIWGGNVSVFEGKAVFVQKIIITGTKPSIKGSVTYQACSSISKQCLAPKSYDFEVNLVATKAGATNTSEKTPVDPVVKNPVPTAATGNQSVEALEKEKEKYTPRDSNGNDISRDYLKNFVHRNGK